MSRRPQAPTGCSLMERIAFHTGKRTKSGCLPWLGAKTEKGYAKAYHGGRKNRKLYTVTRVLLATKLGRPLKAGMEACHSCDHTWCVEPAHLWEGTRKDNQSDMARKGRSLRGERHNLAKLSNRKVLAIRTAFARGERRPDLARRYKVSWGMINFIVKRRNWTHI